MLTALITVLGISAGLAGVLFAAGNTPDDIGPEDEELLTAERRAKMSPKEVLKAFKDGNRRFVNGNLRVRKFIKEVSATSQLQTPFAIVHSCIDSRVPVETIFDTRIGEIFSMRLAGNVINDDVLGSMEFATKLAGAKLILVMGHTRCGAVKGAADSAEFGHLTTLVDKIKVAERRAKKTFTGNEDDPYAYVDHLAREYVILAKEQIHEKSPALAELEASGELLIAGAMYNIGTGKVDFL